MLLKPIVEFIQKKTYHYRKAFTAEEKVEIEEQFNAGKKKEGNFGRQVKANINGLPVLIVRFEKTYDKKVRFWSLLHYLEQAHQLVRWTSTYNIVIFPHRVQVLGIRPNLRPKKEGVLV